MASLPARATARCSPHGLRVKEIVLSASSCSVAAKLWPGLLAVAAAAAWSAVPAMPAQPNRPAAATTGSTVADRLTLDEAVRLGLEHNPQVSAGLAGTAAAERNYRSLAAFPPVNLALTHVRGSSSAPTLNGTTTDTFADFGDTLDTSGQRRF